MKKIITTQLLLIFICSLTILNCLDNILDESDKTCISHYSNSCYYIDSPDSCVGEEFKDESCSDLGYTESCGWSEYCKPSENI